MSSILCKPRNTDLVLSWPLITLLCCDQLGYISLETISCFMLIFLWVTVVFLWGFPKPHVICSAGNLIFFNKFSIDKAHT